MYKTWQSNYKVLIPLTRVQCIVHSLQCTEYSVLAVLYWKHMATEACVNTANSTGLIQIFGACSFYWFLLCFNFFLNCILTFSASKNMFFVKFCVFPFSSQILWIFSVFRIVENWGLNLNIKFCPRNELNEAENYIFRDIDNF